MLPAMKTVFQAGLNGFLSRTVIRVISYPFWIDIAIVALALLVRLVLLDIKPPHFDEGVNGWFADQMTRQGFFRYDPTNYHGPLHFYAVFVSQTLFGRNIWALRLPAIVAAVLAVWAILRFRDEFGPAVARWAALAAALSPAFVFYGRYSIHESWMAFSQILFFTGVFGVWRTGGRRPMFVVIAAAVGMILTKETYFLHLGSFGLAVFILWLWQKASPSRPALLVAKPQWSRSDLAWGGGAGVLTIIFFYSGNFLDFSILHGLYLTFAAWFNTGIEACGHEKTYFTLFGVETLNYYWLRLMAIYEWPALMSLAACMRYLWPSDPRLRLLAIYGSGLLLAYTLIPYKTPWCIISFLWPFLVLFGAIVVEMTRVVCERFGRTAALAAASAFAVVPIAVSSVVMVRVNFLRFDDPSEPYVYVQTFRDIRTFTEPLLGMARRDPRHYHTEGLIVLDSYYPLPWILGDFTRIGYHASGKQPAGPIHAGFVVVEKGSDSVVAGALDGKYFRRDFRLRDAQDGCIVYFRSEPFAGWFLGEEPVEYRPDESGGES